MTKAVKRLTCLPKHGGARDHKVLVTHPMTDICDRRLPSSSIHPSRSSLRMASFRWKQIDNVRVRVGVGCAGAGEHRAVAAAVVLRRQAAGRPAAGGGGAHHARIRRAGHRRRIIARYAAAAAAQLVAG
jgi:hypothetical protein